ncbi:MAG: tetratricopeptide repeat protein [Thiotrichales bacterium]
MIPDAVAAAAIDESEAGNPEAGIALLEPLFDHRIAGTNDAHEYAFDTLCNLYDEVGAFDLKLRMITRILDTSPRSPLRSGAWQRLAAIRMDQDDSPGAWEAFQHAQRDAPDAPSTALLEIQLLMSEQRYEEARESARMWHRRLRRRGSDEYAGILEFLERVAKDPHAAIADTLADANGTAVAALHEQLVALAERQLPHYRLAEVEATATNPRQLRDHLLAMGINGAALEQAIAALEAQMKTLTAEDAAPQAGPPDAPILTLQPPARVAELEREWREVFPSAKPFSVHDQPLDNDPDKNPWQRERASAWIDWLATHPEAYDSIEVLDDLAIALRLHPETDTEWWAETLLRPVLNRAWRMVDQALPPDTQLPWTYPQNRPALRSLFRLQQLEIRGDHEDESLRLAQRLLALNPDDNHDMRSFVIHTLLAHERNADALALARTYPDDIGPSIVYGRALALYRLGQLDASHGAACEAMAMAPKVVRTLLAKAPKPPRSDPFGIRAGGDEEAWLYRQFAFELWQSTPGALDWLRDRRRACGGAGTGLRAK